MSLSAASDQVHFLLQLANEFWSDAALKQNKPFNAQVGRNLLFLLNCIINNLVYLWNLTLIIIKLYDF